MNGIEYLKELKKEIESCKDTRIWVDTTRAVSLISDLIFTRSTHFILEFIQNAEDAGLGQPNDGEMNIKISRKRILITHNAKLFTKNDVNSLCGIRTTKKPELGSIGYLGIGFKSVFKVTDSPHIFSGEFQFKFDKNEWDNPDEELWQIIPLTVENPPIIFDPEKTIFFLPFRNENCYEETKNELKNLGLHLYLFLKWLKKIEIIDEETDETILLENVGIEDGIIKLLKNGEEERFLIFRTNCKVPDDILTDSVTISAKRSKVTNREITVAFKIDEENYLCPLSGSKAYGSIYSFLPIGEENSGAEFLIQADFIVVPGRESINYEAKWNHWLVKEIANLVKDSIEIFKKNDTWKNQYLTLFEFTNYSGQPSFEKLFLPELHNPIQNFLVNNSILTQDGDFVDPNNAVVIGEDTEVLLDPGDLKIIFPEIEYPKPVSHQTELGPFSSEVPTVRILDIAKNEDFLIEKSKKQNAIEWFKTLYSTIFEWADRYRGGSKYLWKKRYFPIPILTENLQIKDYDEVFFKSIPTEVTELINKYSEVKNALLEIYFLHPILENEFSSKFEEYLKIRRFDFSKICEDLFLPQIITTTDPPSKKKLIAFTQLIQKGMIDLYEDIWVLTKNGIFMPSSEVFLSTEYSPSQNWEKNKKYIPNIEFLSEKYIKDEKDNTEKISEWKEFFENSGVKDQGNKNHVDSFGVNYSIEKLKSKEIIANLGYKFSNFDDVQNQSEVGCDFIGYLSNSKKKYIEIKSRVQAKDIELTPNETNHADMYKKDYFLAIVDGIPENPEFYLINDPVKHGKKDRITIPRKKWTNFRIG